MKPPAVPVLLAAALVQAFASTDARAQTFPPGFAAENLATSLGHATCLAVAPDGRVFVGLKDGVVRIWKPGQGLLATPFHSTPVDGRGERGLIGIALGPSFASSGRVYLHVSRDNPPRAEIIHVDPAVPGGDVSNPASETLLFPIGNYTSATNHAGGAIHFGPDHRLYIAVGENATTSNAQSIANLFGKVLRINADGTIPGDNPSSIAGIPGMTAGQNRAIWAAGLRNPFTMAFQPGTGRLFINDVGGGLYEEVNDGLAGRNYGWPDTEGPFTQGNFPAFTQPVFAYPHSGGPIVGSIVVGGAFYNPPAHSYPPEYRSDYFFGDLAHGWIRRRDAATGAILDFATGAHAVGFALDAQGRLLYITHAPAGRLVRVAWSCYPNCDASTGAPVLNVQDFSCYLTAFAAGNPYANCDASTAPPVFNIADFSCYLTRFAQGCP